MHPSVLILTAAVVAVSITGTSQTATVALANDNRIPAGATLGDTLVIALTVSNVKWYLHDEQDGAFSVLAFAEEGKQPMIPAPLVRATEDVTIHLSVRNPLTDTLVVHGLGRRGDGVADSIVVPPGTTTRSRFPAGHPGTYIYWATTSAQPALRRTFFNTGGRESQSRGAFIVDPLHARRDDRVLVLTHVVDQTFPGLQQVAIQQQPLLDRGLMARDFGAINGKSWPHTERLHHTVGDSIRWRVINATSRPHPMHLHGFYFRVDSRGNSLTDRDSILAPDDRPMVVTDVVQIGQTMTLAWSPDRPGGWIFHCHVTPHATLQPAIAERDSLRFPGHDEHHDPDQHALNGMNGLILGVDVQGTAPTATLPDNARRVTLFIQSDSAPADSARRFGYVLQRGTREPARDSVEAPGPVLLLTRGQPAVINVINRSGTSSAVHWHGIELESYYDGVVGFSGTPGVRTTPAIRDGRSFEVRLTPRRAGTFMYHTHFDELRQQFGGLVGPIVVLDSGQAWDPERDKVFMISDVPGTGGRRNPAPGRIAIGPVAINGSPSPPAIQLQRGVTYRFRFADLAADRPLLHVRLLRDSTLLPWRPIAKDGFALSAKQATARPVAQRVGSGETIDLEFTADQAGDVQLEFGEGRRMMQIFARLQVRIR